MTVLLLQILGPKLNGSENVELSSYKNLANRIYPHNGSNTCCQGRLERGLRTRRGSLASNDLIKSGIKAYEISEKYETSQMITKLADFYEDEVTASVKSLTSIMEPLMIVFVAVFVGLILIAMYLPMFSMMQTVG